MHSAIGYPEKYDRGEATCSAPHTPFFNELAARLDVLNKETIESVSLIASVNERVFGPQPASGECPNKAHHSAAATSQIMARIDDLASNLHQIRCEISRIGNLV